MHTLAAYKNQINFVHGISADAAVGPFWSLTCQIPATTTKKPKMRIWRMRPPRMMFSPRLKPEASEADTSMPAPPPWIILEYRVSMMASWELCCFLGDVQAENVAANEKLG